MHHFNAIMVTTSLKIEHTRKVMAQASLRMQLALQRGDHGKALLYQLKYNAGSLLESVYLAKIRSARQWLNGPR